MKRILDSFHEPADHLAMDEAALLQADQGTMGESLRLWEFSRQVVVLGRSSKVQYEVDLPYCQQMDVPVLRRCSGGASIVGGPGCLMYSVVINLDRQRELRKIDQAHTYVMSRVLAAVQNQVPDASLQGTCDLTIGGKKFSGNSLRIARSHLLYHGTILYAVDLDLIANCLAEAPRQPEYRDGREHRDFVTNVSLDPNALGHAIAENFDASVVLTELPLDQIRRLREERYDDPAWHLRH